MDRLIDNIKERQEPMKPVSPSAVSRILNTDPLAKRYLRPPYACKKPYGAFREGYVCVEYGDNQQTAIGRAADLLNLRGYKSKGVDTAGVVTLIVAHR
ncbi:MAG: hypothetical protein E6R04_03380 [Spirochaetes bacterium]|nr:MAG: hypothetical protein E6R04_03380 [Spirochaetota bacterium]